MTLFTVGVLIGVGFGLFISEIAERMKPRIKGLYDMINERDRKIQKLENENYQLKNWRESQKGIVI